jgi:RNA polymerase sigma factor (sigma-70 family)
MPIEQSLNTRPDLIAAPPRILTIAPDPVAEPVTVKRGDRYFGLAPIDQDRFWVDLRTKLVQWAKKEFPKLPTEDHEDLAQDALIKIGMLDDQSASDARFDSLARAIVTNRGRDLIRKRKTLKRGGDRKRFDLDDCVDQAARQEGQKDVVSEAVRETLATAFSKLSQKHRDLLNMRFGSELTFAEIGELLRKKSGSVRAEVSRAVKRLAEFFPDIKPQQHGWPPASPPYPKPTTPNAEPVYHRYSAKPPSRPGLARRRAQGVG